MESSNNKYQGIPQVSKIVYNFIILFNTVIPWVILVYCIQLVVFKENQISENTEKVIFLAIGAATTWLTKFNK